MIEKTGSGEALTERLFNFEIGSAESRATARQLVDRPKKAPNILFVFVNPYARDSDDLPIGPVEINSRSATIEGSNKKLIREEGETQGSFERRVAEELPAIGLPRLAYLFPDDLLPETPPPIGEESQVGKPTPGRN